MWFTSREGSRYIPSRDTCFILLNSSNLSVLVSLKLNGSITLSKANYSIKYWPQLILMLIMNLFWPSKTWPFTLTIHKIYFVATSQYWPHPTPFLLEGALLSVQHFEKGGIWKKWMAGGLEEVLPQLFVNLDLY